MSSELVDVDPEAIAARWPVRRAAYVRVRPGIRRTTHYEFTGQIGEGTYG
jgi:hypothetical protein